MRTVMEVRLISIIVTIGFIATITYYYPTGFFNSNMQIGNFYFKTYSHAMPPFSKTSLILSIIENFVFFTKKLKDSLTPVYPFSR